MRAGGGSDHADVERVADLVLPGIDARGEGASAVGITRAGDFGGATEHGRQFAAAFAHGVSGERGKCGGQQRGGAGEQGGSGLEHREFPFAECVYI